MSSQNPLFKLSDRLTQELILKHREKRSRYAKLLKDGQALLKRIRGFKK